MPPPRRPRRPVEVVLDASLTSWYSDLKLRANRGSKDHRTLRDALERLFDVLVQDFQHGEVVRRPRIPPKLIARFGIGNLYVEDLPGFHRMLYTVEGTESSVIVIVLAVLDHREYDRLFGFRRR